jgi:hypothetical protein
MQEPVPVPKEDLMRRLVNAKKVMNKVDGGDFTKGNIDPTALQQNQSNLVSDAPKQNVRNVASNVVNEDKIRNSKLPDAIKQAMINNPIPTVDNISLSDNLDLSIVEGAKKLMEKEGLSSTSQKAPTLQTQPTSNVGGDLKSIIKETIKETLEEIVDRKLELILTASQTASINENLVLKVGDSIFKGKITGVNKAKKKD